MFAFADERAVFAPLSDLQVALYRVLLDFPVPKMVKISNDPCICDSGKTRAKCCFKVSVSLLARHVHLACYAPGAVLHTFWVRGHAIGKGIDFTDICIRNGIDFHNFGMKNGTISRFWY